MVLKIIPKVICRSLTMGSTLMTKRGGFVKAYHMRLLGGRFTLTRRLPSSSRTTTAKTSLTGYDLKRAPRLITAVASTVARISPLYKRPTSNEASPSLVSSLSMGLLSVGALLPTENWVTAMSVRNAGRLTLDNFFMRRPMMYDSSIWVL